MKTAVSIPDEIFHEAERLARRTKRSRSRLFSDALREYLARWSPDKVTEAMDAALAEIDEPSDVFRGGGAHRVLKRTERGFFRGGPGGRFCHTLPVPSQDWAGQSS